MQSIMRFAMIGATMFISITIFALHANAQPQDSIPIPGSTTGAVAERGTLTYPITQALEAANIFAVLLNVLVGIVVTAAFLYFFWNLVKYIRDEEDKDKAKTKMGYSIAAIFVIVTLWGIIGFVRGILGIGTGEEQVNTVLLPGVGTSRCSGNNVYVRYMSKDGSPTKSPTGEAGFCAPRNKVTSACCNGVVPPQKTGLTLCKNASKCHLDGECPQESDRVADVASINDYACDF